MCPIFRFFIAVFNSAIVAFVTWYSVNIYVMKKLDHVVLATLKFSLKIAFFRIYFISLLLTQPLEEFIIALLTHIGWYILFFYLFSKNAQFGYFCFSIKNIFYCALVFQFSYISQQKKMNIHSKSLRMLALAH